MLRKLVAAAALAVGTMLAVSPASALPIDRGITAEAGESQATQIYHYYGHRYYGRRYYGRRYYAPYYAPRRYYKRRYYYY